MKFKVFALTMFFLALSLMAFSVQADDEKYPGAPLPNASFVRFFNVDKKSALSTRIRGKAYSSALPGQVGAYFAVSDGEAELKLGISKVTETLKIGAYYSVGILNGEMLVLEEPAYDSRLKAQIVLVNLSKADSVSLKTANGATSVIASVASGKLGVRAVNALKIGFAVYVGDKKIADLSERMLERGAGYAVLVYEDRDGKFFVSYDKS